MGLRVLRGGRRQIGNVSTYVGEYGTVFYDENTGTLRLSDGVTPGGINNVLPVATSTQLGAIKAGAGVNITSQGVLTIDISGLPAGFGDFYAYTNTGPSGGTAAWLSSVVTNEDIVISSNGTGEVAVVGTFGVYSVDGPLNTRNPEFFIDNDGQITIKVPTTDPYSGAVRIIGSASGATQDPVNTSVMLHITGNNNDNARLYVDGIAGYGGFVGRRFNGTAASPSGVLNNQEIARFVANGRHSTGWNLQGSARMSIYANEDQLVAAQGGRVEFWVTPNGQDGTNQVKTMSMIANSVTMHGNANVVGNLTVGNISASGITGTLANGNSNVAIAANGNVSVSATGTANVVVIANTGAVVNGNITYSTASGDAGTVTQTGSKTATVIANGRTGRIVTTADSLGQGTAITFTVTNSYVAATDVVVLNLKGGATVNSYTTQVANVAAGSFQIQIRNFTNGALAEALTFNFAVIKVT